MSKSNKTSKRRSQGKKSKVNKETSGQGRKTRAWLLCLVPIALVVAGVVAWQVWQSSANTVRMEDVLLEQRTPIQQCSASVDSVLSASSGKATVYDAAGSMLFTLTGANAIESVPELPESVKSAFLQDLIGQETSTPIDIEEYVDKSSFVKTLVGTPSIKELTAGSLSWVAVNAFCNFTGTALSEDAKVVVASALDELYDVDSLLRYILSVSRFGTVQGLTSASRIWFETEVSSLSAEQVAYACYARENAKASLEDFKSVDAVSAGKLSFVQEGRDKTVGNLNMRQRVQEELLRILGVDSLDKEYNVELQIDQDLQNTIQATIDSKMLSSIMLGTNNQTVLDASTMVVDSSSGFVLAYTGNRSINSTAPEVSFNETSNIGAYTAMLDLFEKDNTKTWATLVKQQELSGSETLVPLCDVVASQRLDLLGITPELSPKCTLSELSSFMLQLYLSGKPRFISQVTDANGKTVYTAKGYSNVSERFAQSSVRALLSMDTDAKSFDYTQYTSSGAVIATANSHVIVCGLYGANAEGYKLSDNDLSMCIDVATGVLDNVTARFPLEGDSIDPRGTVAQKLSATRSENLGVITELVEDFTKDLREMEINSTESRQEFESMLYYCTNALGSYWGLVEDDALTELANSIEEVRVERTDELLKYSA